MKIGVLTSGGDAPGMNAAVRTVAVVGIARGHQVVGVARCEADALTLWHLLTRLTGAEREAVYDRMAALAPPPYGVTREGVLAGDHAMLERWWDALGFGQSPWRRAWKKVTG